MPGKLPVLLLTQEATLDDGVLRVFAPRRFEKLAEIRKDIEGSVVIATPEQGRESGERRAAQMLEHVLEIGRALASEKDLDSLLGLILTHARHLTGADGASVYTRDAGGKLYFRQWQNASTGATSNARKTLVGDYSIAGHVAREGKAVMLEDAYALPPDAPYQLNPASAPSIRYLTQSLLTVPLKNKADEVVGVLQLINRKDDPGAVLRPPEGFENSVRSFDEQDRPCALALAGGGGRAR